MTAWTKAAAAAVVLAAGAGAYAFERGQQRDGYRGFGKLTRKLDLSREQTEKAREIEDRKVKETIRLRGQVAYARYEMHQLLEAPDVDRARVMAKVDEMARLHAEIHKARIAARLDQKELLTPEQREKLAGMKAERRERDDRPRKHRRHPRGDGEVPGAPPDPPAPSGEPGL